MTTEQCVCPSCEIRNDIVDSMISVVVGIFNSTDSIKDTVNKLETFFNDVYDDIYEEGRKEAYSDIAGFAIHNIKRIDGCNDCDCDECDCEVD